LFYTLLPYWLFSVFMYIMALVNFACDIVVNKKLEALGQCVNPPRYVLLVLPSGSGPYPYPDP